MFIHIHEKDAGGWSYFLKSSRASSAKDGDVLHASYDDDVHRLERKM